MPWEVGRRSALGLGVGAALARPAIARVQPPITLGLTPVFLDSDLVLLEQLEAELGARTGGPVSLVQRRTYQEIIAMLVSGQLTAAWICGYPYVRLEAKLSLLAVPLYRKQPLYQSYLLARSDLAGEHLDDFKGRSHAFSDPDSNSGWLVTRHLLGERNTTPEQFFSRTFFAYGHRNVVRAVASGLADTGSVDGYVWDVLSQTEPQLTSATRVVKSSGPFGFPPIACLTATLETAEAKSLQIALLGLASHATGRALLKTLELDGFTEGDPALYASIGSMAAIVPS